MLGELKNSPTFTSEAMIKSLCKIVIIECLNLFDYSTTAAAVIVTITGTVSVRPRSSVTVNFSFT